MFSIGDKIVYPSYGGGVINSIEEKEVLGERKKYYILDMVISGMEIMVPIDNINKLGIRHVINKSQVEDLMKILKDEQGDMDKKWNKRYRDNMDKIKTGDIYEIAVVVRDLMIQDKEKGLSTGEKKMLNDAKDMLISELVLALNESSENVKNLIENIMNAD
ncbi:CarD family transcriptional regulator [Tepidibacter formicigenes]|jgi:CarD family transcriptional regulator|uniref:Transcriptional regulator, CarD family n=1 Tax=Tepidibacter formicigenes DSM 15518 TaxID=1123349 RepID=A0A1M6QLX0_9FIRM|nr:CarD family transcriptional regulator [Tepidibacter formicigenes]SHK21100.1 transcriptional regulator, CarD family [Tepidibacter formicigenes DSM 15518]